MKIQPINYWIKKQLHIIMLAIAILPQTAMGNRGCPNQAEIDDFDHLDTIKIDKIIVNKVASIDRDTVIPNGDKINKDALDIMSGKTVIDTRYNIICLENKTNNGAAVWLYSSNVKVTCNTPKALPLPKKEAQAGVMGIGSECEATK